MRQRWPVFAETKTTSAQFTAGSASRRSFSTSRVDFSVLPSYASHLLARITHLRRRLTSTRGSSRIEGILARSIKKNAVRAVDLFKEWDEDGSGGIDKSEFFRAIRALDFAVERADTDAVFDARDADKSGTVDRDECKKGFARLTSDSARAALAYLHRPEAARVLLPRSRGHLLGQL